MGIMEGMNTQRIRNFLKTQVSHIQVHNPDFVQEQDVQKYLAGSEDYLQQIRNYPEVEGAAERVVVNGMASSPTNSSGVDIKGIKPKAEKQVTNIHQNLKDERYFDEKTRNPVVMGKKLAEQLGVEQGSKVVLNFQNLEGDITAGSFTIAGLFETSNAQFDKTTIFIPIEKARALLEKPNIAHEIAIFLKDREAVDKFLPQLNKNLPEGYLAQSWRDIQPSLAYINDFSTQMLYFIMLIILLGLAFGIINTMLMAVMERTRELGMLMAVGMSKAKVFRMVIIETTFLALQGAVFGLLIGWLTIQYLGTYGINLANLSEGLSSFGYSEKVYPMLANFHYPVIAGLVFLTAILSAIYPAIKALKLKPAEAIRAI